MPFTRIRSVSRSVSTISRSPSSTALCSGWMLADTTANCGSSRSRPGRCLRIRASGSRDRSTKRSISSPSGDSVTSRYFSSPLRPGTS